MSLSKQLYIIISFIFFMIFTGNFVISVNNTKEYLESESITKAQDTATSLGMTLKTFMQDKNDPEIETIIKAIANRGFYKEIRLEDIHFSLTPTQLLQKLDKNSGDWTVSNVAIDEKYGTITSPNDDNELMDELASLDNQSQGAINTQNESITYIFTPSKAYKQGGVLPLSVTYDDGNIPITEEIQYEFDKILVQQSREEKFDYVPQWFIDLVPLNLEETQSEISNGWNKAAVIYVSANAGEAYAKLYEQVKKAIYYAIVAFLISIALLAIFLQFILKPLKNIEKLAQNIAKGHFGVIQTLPWTTEVKNVAIAMNDMSTKIESIISKLNNNLANITKQLSIDNLTGLQLKQTFETDMKKMFMSKSYGYVLSIKLDDLATYANKNTSKDVNNFIKNFANILDTCKSEFCKNVSAYRFYGSEFSVIAKEFSHERAIQLVEHFKKEFDKLGQSIDKDCVAHIGATPFNPIGTTAGILDAANEAYELAKQVGPNEAHIRDESDLTRDMQEWEELIYDIIDNGKFKVGYIGDAHVLNGEEQGKLVMQEAFTQAEDKNKDSIPIGTFISIAEKYEKVIDFDKSVVNKVIEYIHQNKITHEISINLSLDSIEDSTFIAWLLSTIRTHQNIACQLVFSITAYAVAKDEKKFKLFSKAIHDSGAKIIIKRFETKFIALDNIKEFHLDYIRLARDYTNGIANESSKQGFVEAMQELSTLINIKVYAENVKDEEDFKTVKALHVYGASR